MVRSGAGLGPGLLRVIGRTRPWPGLARGEAPGLPQHSALGPPNITNLPRCTRGYIFRRRSRVTRPPDASPYDKTPPDQPVRVLSWLPWAGHSTWTPCAAWPTVGARRQDRPMHRGRRGYMSAQGVSPGRCTVSCASKRDGYGQHVAPASSDKQISSRGRHPPRRHAMA